MLVLWGLQGHWTSYHKGPQVSQLVNIDINHRFKCYIHYYHNKYNHQDITTRQEKTPCIKTRANTCDQTPSSACFARSIQLQPSTENHGICIKYAKSNKYQLLTSSQPPCNTTPNSCR